MFVDIYLFTSFKFYLLTSICNWTTTTTVSTNTSSCCYRKNLINSHRRRWQRRRFPQHARWNVIYRRVIGGVDNRTPFGEILDGRQVFIVNDFSTGVATSKHLVPNRCRRILDTGVYAVHGRIPAGNGVGCRIVEKCWILLQPLLLFLLVG